MAKLDTTMASSFEPEPEAGPPPRGQRLLAVGLTGVLLIGAAGLFVLAPSLITNYKADAAFYESPAFIPRVALALVACCALIHVIRVLRGASLDAGEELDDESANRGVVAASIPVFAAYVLLIPLLGYLTATVLFIVGGGLLAGIGWRKTGVLALSLGIACFLIFAKALNVWFPAASLFTFF